MMTQAPQALHCFFWDLPGGWNEVIFKSLSKSNSYPWIIELAVEF